MRRLWQTIAILLGAAALLVALSYPLSRARIPIRDVLFSRIGGALWRAGSRVHNFVSPAETGSTQELATLKEQRNALTIENARLRDAAHENAVLRDQLRFATSTQFTLLAAEVVAGSANPDVRTVTINVGTNGGAAVGDAVVVGNGLVVGSIRVVTARTAIVELLTDSRSRFSAALLTEQGFVVTGVVEGGHGTGMVLTLIPQDVRIAIGDPIITAGLDAHVPRGLILGTVESVSVPPNEPFQEAVLSPQADLETLTLVAVVKRDAVE